MAFPISPGVFLQDTQCPPEWQAKGAMMFVGAFAKGPAGIPVLVKTADQAVAIFGAANANQVTATALHHFFAQGGRSAIVLRIPVGHKHWNWPSGPRALDADCRDEHPADFDDFDPGPDPIDPAGDKWAKAFVTALCKETAAAAGDGRPSRSVLSVLTACAPGAVEMLVAPAAATLDRLSAGRAYRKLHALAVAEDIFLLLDPHTHVGQADSMRAWFSALALGESENAVALAPNLSCPETGVRCLAPSGPVAGLLDRVARTDGIWSPPAGPQARLRGLQISGGLDGALPQHPSGKLNVLGTQTDGLSFSQDGIFSRAGREAPRLRALRVLRKTRLTLRSELARLMRETDPESRRSEARLIAEALMVQLWRDGALRGHRTAQAFRITTTAPDPTSGMFELCVGLALQAPGKYQWVSVAIS